MHEMGSLKGTCAESRGSHTEFFQTTLHRRPLGKFTPWDSELCTKEKGAIEKRIDGLIIYLKTVLICEIM